MSTDGEGTDRPVAGSPILGAQESPLYGCVIRRPDVGGRRERLNPPVCVRSKPSFIIT